MPEDYDLETLANGVTIAWKHVPDVPDIATAIVFRVGTSNSPNGISQAPYFVEHMFFKPTPAHPTHIPTLIKKITGRDIAGTGAETWPEHLIAKRSASCRR